MQNISTSQLGFAIAMGKLSLSGATVTFAPYNGNGILLGNQVTLIPAAGVSLTIATTLIEGGLMVDSTTYNVYAKLSGGTLIIQPSATATAISALGAVCRTGETSASFVGTVTTGVGTIASVTSFFNLPPSYLLDRANHTGFQDAATINSGIFDISRIPIAALERLVIVADQAARYALTTAQVQQGDTVLQTSPNNEMYFVVDTANLGNSAGYQIYNATAIWASISGKPQIIQDIAAITGPSESDVIQYVSGSWVKRSIAQLKASLALNLVDIAMGTTTVASAAGVVTIDTAALTNHYQLTLTENVTSWVFNTLPAAGYYRDIYVHLIQDAATARTVVSPATAGRTAGGTWVVSSVLSSRESLGLRIFSDGTVHLFPSGVMG